ncbi:MAG: hypothetical protein MEQ07_10640 [Aquimonas sp.]|nr:hypothetical protein [Aquimonas sp.]
MRIAKHTAAGLLCALSLVPNLAFWGGLAHSPQVAPVLQERLPSEAPLAYTWWLIGGAVGGMSGMDAALVEFAESRLEGIEGLVESKPLAVDRVMAARPTWLRTLHPAPLLLFAVAAVLWWRRPRHVSLFKSR